MHEKLAERWNAISLRSKMTGVSVLLLTLGLMVAGVGSATVLRNYLTQQVDLGITSVSNGLEAPVFGVSEDRLTCQINTVPTEYYVGVYDPDGRFLCANEPSNQDQPAIGEPSLAMVVDPHPTTVPGQSTRSDWRIIGSVAPIKLGDSLLVVVVGHSLDQTDTLVSRFTAIFLFFALTVVVLGAALTRLLVTSTFSPLREVEATAARFAAGDFSQRLGGATPNTEVGRLNASLNSMLNRIDRLFSDRAKTIDQMRRFVGDASHELRTPLVSVRGYAELYRMGALPDKEAVGQAMERIEKEAIRMGELVSDLLELARIDETKPLQLAKVDLVALARDAALDAMASSPDRVVSVLVTDAASDSPAVVSRDADAADPASSAPTTTAADALSTGRLVLGATIARLRGRRPTPKPLIIDPVVIAAPEQAASTTSSAMIVAEENKIRQVITNLMGNAVRFTPNGSPIEIGVGIDASRNVALLSIIDHGEGIPPQIRDKIFQRFWRADTSRNRDTGGSGLGLAIVASIVASHKGEIEVVETPGGGATFRVVLPVLQSQPDHTPSPIPE